MLQSIRQYVTGQRAENRNSRLPLSAMVLAVLFLLRCPVPGQAVMESAPFYRLGIGARALGMGGAFVAVADDPTTIYWNPSGLPEIDSMALSAMHLTPFQMDSSHDFVTTVFPLGEVSTWGMYYLRASTPDIPITQLGTDGLPDIVEYAKNDRNLLAFSYGRKFGKRFSAGFTLKYLSEKLSNAKATAWGSDIGFLFQASSSLKLGFAVQDVTETLISWNTGHSDTVPQRYTFGLSGKLLEDKLTLALDANIMKQRPSEWHLGSEYVFANMLSVRAGLDARKLTAGLGFRFGRWEMDYAFENHDLGDHHRLSFTVWWAPEDEDKTTSAKVESILGQYHETLDQLLELEPEQEKTVWENRRDWVPPYSTEAQVVPFEPRPLEKKPDSLPPIEHAVDTEKVIETEVVPVKQEIEEEEDFIDLLDSVSEPESKSSPGKQPASSVVMDQEPMLENFLSTIESEQGGIETETEYQEQTTGGIKYLPPVKQTTSAPAALQQVPSLPSQPFKESLPRIYTPAPSKEDTARIEKVREDLKFLSNCLKSYNYLTETTARSLKELENKSFDQVPLDPWGTPYRFDSEKGIVISAGKDRELGTLDDLQESIFN
ncbi:MAG: PorV/PorQ family protein [bacterium]|nr:PorV/PorQ family protein [bacterium]